MDHTRGLTLRQKKKKEGKKKKQSPKKKTDKKRRKCSRPQQENFSKENNKSIKTIEKEIYNWIRYGYKWLNIS